MTIKYLTADTVTTVNDSASNIIREAFDHFNSQGIGMTSKRGFEEIISHSGLFEDYKDKMLEGLEADEYEQLSQLYENNRKSMLTGEALTESVSGIQPVAGLTMPTIRKLWPRLALKNAIPTQPVKSPKFLISYLVPYLQHADGTRSELPGALRKPNNGKVDRPRLQTTPIALPAEEFDLLAPVGASKAVGDAIDPSFSVTSVTLKATVGGVEETIKVPTNILISKEGTLYGVVRGTASDGTEVTDTFLGAVSLRDGIFEGTSVKQTVVDVTVQGYLSTENNTRSESVNFDVANRDVTIGTASHLNAALPVEFLEDLSAMYNIDGALETVELMSSVIAQKTDLKFIEFFDFSFERAGRPYEREFDVMPSASFANRPKEWREELKTIIDYLAEEMKLDTNFDQGKFVLVGNPIDMMLLPNADWVFNHATETRSGTNVNYNLGAISGINLYELVSSPNVPRGSIRMLFIPSSDRQMTYKYFPYSFHVERGTYRDPQRPLLPSIMMTKRDTIEEFTPLMAKITITNNNGTLPR